MLSDNRYLETVLCRPVGGADQYEIKRKAWGFKIPNLAAELNDY